MRPSLISVLLVLLTGLTAWADPRPAEPAVGYRWLAQYDPAQSLQTRIPTPRGYERPAVQVGSFADWLRHLPLKPGRPRVMLFDGTPRDNQQAHVAVINMDVGNRDLQQCADSIIRLRAEYLLASGKPADIHFKFTSGHVADWTEWAAGGRPVVKGSKVTWTRTAAADDSYASFRRYLDLVFTYAGTRSLSGEMKAVVASDPIEIGDAFVAPGSPGHAVIVVDVAIQTGTGKRMFLLAQGFMPAQDMHILRNPADPTGGPWYDANFGEELRMPEMTLARDGQRRF